MIGGFRPTLLVSVFQGSLVVVAIKIVNSKFRVRVFTVKGAMKLMRVVLNKISDLTFELLNYYDLCQRRQILRSPVVVVGY